MHTQAEKLMVVIDPSRSSHIALQRAMTTLGLRETAPHVRLFVSSEKASFRANSKRQERLLEEEVLPELTERLENHNIAYDYEFCWSADMEKSILNSARQYGASLIFNPVYNETLRRHQGLSRARWELLRQAECPVILVKPESSKRRKVILAAVNFQSNSPDYRSLNRRIIERAKWLEAKYDARLYVVNAYEDLMDYPDYEKLQEAAGLEYERIRILSGAPEKVIVNVARNLEADLILIGTRNSHDATGKYRRNTAEKILAALNTDMIVIN